MDVNPIVRYLNTLKRVGSVKGGELGFLSVYLFLNHIIEENPIGLSKNDICNINAMIYCLRNKSCLLQNIEEFGCPNHDIETFYFYYAVIENQNNAHAVDYITLNDLIKSHSLTAQMSMTPGSRFIVLYDEQKLNPIQYKIETKLGDDIGTDFFNDRIFYNGHKLINGKVYTSVELLYYNTGNVEQNVYITFENITN